MQRQQKLQSRAIVGDIQGATAIEITIHGYCGRYSGCNDVTEAVIQGKTLETK